MRARSTVRVARITRPNAQRGSGVDSPFCHQAAELAASPTRSRRLRDLTGGWPRFCGQTSGSRQVSRGISKLLLMTRSRAAQRVLDAAMREFANRGVATTTVADIERAAGLTPGAGGIYRHFTSKIELLETGVREALANLEALEQHFYGEELALRDFLTLYVRGGLTALRNHRSLIRLFYRDLSAFPELFEEAKQRLVWVGTADLATRLRLEVKERRAGRRSNIDFDAVAAIFAGAVVDVVVIEALLDTPAPVDDDRFVSAWVDTLATYLDQGATS